MLFRFPDTEILSSMCVLGMRPITLLGDDELEDWGNNSINILIDHFGQPKTHKYVTAASDDTPSRETLITSDALIEPEKTRIEWQQIKQVVKQQGYPRPSTAKLWGLIKEFHGDDYPNLIKLVQLALAHPVHTADCERAFSAQNSITTPLRNKLSPDHCDQLMRIMIEGGSLNDHDFAGAIQVWKRAKVRKIKL